VPTFLYLFLLCMFFPATSWVDMYAKITYYRCKNSHFPVSTSCMPIEYISSSFPAVKHGLILAQTTEKHLSGWTEWLKACLKAIGGIHFTMKWIAEPLQYGLDFDNFQTPAWNRYLQMQLFAERFLFWRWFSLFFFFKRESRPI
jgi:hypothetical protein